MKQFVVLDHFLKVRDIGQTDKAPTVYDCIVPQKTTLVFDKDLQIQDEDVCLIRDNGVVEFIGVVDTIEKDKVTTVSILPFIAICDNELKVDVLNAVEGESTVQEYIQEQIENNFVNTEDTYSRFNIVVNDMTTSPVYYKAVAETDNLLDVLNEIYLNTGLYIDFGVTYSLGEISTIQCNIYNANEQEVKQIRYDNPQIVDKVDYKFSQYDNYSKAVIQVGDTDRRFEFYLRKDNVVTTNPEDTERIKKVKTKNVKFTAEYSSQDELAEALVLMAQKTLCGDAFAYSIEFKILRKAINDWRFRQRCNFYAPDRLYESFITKIEYLSDKDALVTLGAYRYTLTDKFKALQRQPKSIGDSLDGITISNRLGQTIYWFTKDGGNLYFNWLDGETPPKVDVGTANERLAFHIEDNNLIYEYEGDEPDLSIEDGNLIYKY